MIAINASAMPIRNCSAPNFGDNRRHIGVSASRGANRKRIMRTSAKQEHGAEDQFARVEQQHEAGGCSGPIVPISPIGDTEERGL